MASMGRWGNCSGVPLSDEQEFFGRAQRRMSDFTMSERPKPEDIVTALRYDWSPGLQADQDISRADSTVTAHAGFEGMAFSVMPCGSFPA